MNIYGDFFNEQFWVVRGNTRLDVSTKRIGLKAAPSVVCLKIISGNKEIRWGSGFILECNNQVEYIIITSTSLLKIDHTSNVLLDDLKVVVVLSDRTQCHGDLQAHDFHYNLAAIKIEVRHAIQIAKTRFVEDSMPVTVSTPEEQPFSLHPHRDVFRLVPGRQLIALGRFHEDGEIMIAPGVFSIEQCGFDCKDLLRSTCRITKCGIGGPVINRNAEVIGVNFFSVGFTPFLPSNIVCKWWKHFQMFKEYRQPFLGLELSNLYTIEARDLERIFQKFPYVKEAIVVDEVIPNSPASSSMVLPDDIIVEFDGKAVKSCLQFFDLTWDKVGKPVNLVVLRRRDNSRTDLSVTVANICDHELLNRWRIPGGG